MAKHCKSDRFAILDLKRSKLVPNKSSISDTLKPAEPSQPPGKLSLRLSLGEKIGAGACGFVYEATDVFLSGSPRPPKSTLPPLVVKICRNYQPYKLPREAFIYEEMESIHGLVVPRYYGCFETVIPPGVAFPIWQLHDEYIGSDLSQIDHPNIPRVVTMIVMERLGDQHLPVNRSFDKSLQYVISVLILCVIVTYFYNLVVSCYVYSAISAIWAFRIMTCDGPTS